MIFNSSCLADWWSFGVLLYELLTGSSPFTFEGDQNSHQEISKRILRGNAIIPDELSPEVKDLLGKILVIEPERRLGSKNAQQIKDHPFFRSIDWKELAARRVPAPFIPNIANELDTSNFADEFTRLAPNVSLLMETTDSNINDDEDDDEDLFEGYSYVAPSMLQPKLRKTNRKPHRPDIVKLVKYSENAFFRHYKLIDIGNSSGKIDGLLGSGTFSICHRCIHLETQQQYAVKIVSRHWRRDSGSVLTDPAWKEHLFLKTCSGHQNIVQFKEMFKDDDYIFIVLELLSGGELMSRIRSLGAMEEEQALKIFRQLASTVHFLHSSHIIHRDLKPEVSN